MLSLCLCVYVLLCWMLSEGVWCGGVLELRSIVFCALGLPVMISVQFFFPPGKLLVPVSVTGYLK